MTHENNFCLVYLYCGLVEFVGVFGNVSLFVERHGSGAGGYEAVSLPGLVFDVAEGPVCGIKIPPIDLVWKIGSQQVW